MSRAINLMTRTTSGDLKRKKFNYIDPGANATTMQAACIALCSLLTNGYVDADIIDTYSLNEEVGDNNNG